jgi:hypothetical protein
MTAIVDTVFNVGDHLCLIYFSILPGYLLAESRRHFCFLSFNTVRPIRCGNIGNHQRKSYLYVDVRSRNLHTLQLHQYKYLYVTGLIMFWH